ncbi:MAG: hypothetical protein SH821_08510 [Phototrophicales bacterium]|nr:hypothetical protein [Phototrophicales bacterium]
MGFSANWDNDEKTILRQLYIDRWTVDDFIACTDKTYRLLNNIPHTVHVLIDLSQATRTPANILSAMRYAEERVNDNVGQVVVVGADDFAKEIFSPAKRIAPNATRTMIFVETLPEAYDYLAETSLPTS